MFRSSSSADSNKSGVETISRTHYPPGPKKPERTFQANKNLRLVSRPGAWRLFLGVIYILMIMCGIFISGTEKYEEQVQQDGLGLESVANLSFGRVRKLLPG